MKYSSLRQGLVGAWCPSLGATGYRLLDRSGYGNHGTLTNMDAGTDWVGGLYGPNIEISGSSGGFPFLTTQERIQIARDFGALNVIGISFWIYRGNSDQRTIFGVGPNGTIGRIGISVNASNLLNVYRGNAVFAIIPIITSAWNHVYIFNNAVTTSFFINGKFSNTANQNISQTAQSESYIGSGYFGSITGKIDDFRIYNRALTLAEISLLASEPGIGLRPERTSLYFADAISSRRRKILTGLT